jgi:hypothetical protein
MECVLVYSTALSIAKWVVIFYKKFGDSLGPGERLTQRRRGAKEEAEESRLEPLLASGALFSFESAESN